MAHKIISEVRKKRGQMIGGMQRLCDAYITLAYMDASRHKTEKSESSFVRSTPSRSFLRCEALSSAPVTPPLPAPTTEAIPIPADQPIMKIKDLEEVTIPTMEIKANTENYSTNTGCVSMTVFFQNKSIASRVFNKVQLLFASVSIELCEAH